MSCYRHAAAQYTACRTGQRKLPARGPARNEQFANQQLGFTLIELLIAVVIVAILASIAYPSYMSSIRKSRRASAKTALLDLASREERFFSTNNKYSSTPADLGYSTLPASIPSGSQNYYQLSVSAASDTSFTLLAVPSGDQKKDTSCYTYQLDNAGAQKNFDAGNNALSSSQCW